MKGFWKSSVGKKIIMSLSGIFLMLFLLMHLSVNLTMLIDPVKGDVYNKAAHFMSTNPIIEIIEPILVLGFVLHILYSIIVQINNWKARGNSSYAEFDQNKSSSWASRNMIWLGIFILGFLVLHIINFTVKIKFGNVAQTPEGIDDTFKLVVSLFDIWWYDIIYIISFIALGLHLHHAFWSALQTIGLNNSNWMRRLQVIGDVYTYVVVIGFTIIPLYFLIF